ncbi:MAG: hypothetical protein V4568_17805 [Pseudomonadota bacterium]
MRLDWEGEAAVRGAGVPATIVRPWYVLGPGHRWPYLLMPIYAVLRRLARTKESAERFGLVNLQMTVNALMAAVVTPPVTGIYIMGVPEIRRAKIIPLAPACPL